MIAVRLAAALGLASILATAAPQNPTFSSRVEAVRVDVLVTSGGRTVPGLSRQDFELRDNGVLQQIDLVGSEELPIAVVLALDTSGSLTAERRQHLRDAASGLLDGLKPDDKAGLVTFSHVVAQRSTLTGRIAQIRSALESLTGGGNTSLVDGCYSAMMLAQSEAGRALLIVFSDGLDTASWLTADRVLDAAGRSDVVAYAVSVSRGRTPAFLRGLTDATGGRLYENRSTADLRATFLRVVEEFRHRYLLTYSPAGVAKEGWHRLEVKVKGRRVNVQARPGYVGG